MHAGGKCGGSSGPLVRCLLPGVSSLLPSLLFPTATQQHMLSTKRYAFVSVMQRENLTDQRCVFLAERGSLLIGVKRSFSRETIRQHFEAHLKPSRQSPLSLKPVGARPVFDEVLALCMEFVLLLTLVVEFGAAYRRTGCHGNTYHM